MEPQRLRKRIVALIWLNVVFAAGVSGIAGPVVSGGFGSQDSALYTVRAVVLGAAVLVLAIVATRTRTAGRLPLILALAGVVQTIDVPVLIRFEHPGVAAAAAVFAIVHLGTAWLLSRAQRS